MGIPSRIQKISQWNKCSTHLRNWCPNKMRSMEWKQLIVKTLHGSIYLWLVMNKSSVFSAQVYVFSDSVLCLGKIHENPNQTLHGNKDWSGSKLHRNTEPWSANGIRVDFLPRIHHIAACPWSPRVTVEIQWKHKRLLQEGSSSGRCSTTSHGDQKTTR